MALIRYKGRKVSGHWYRRYVLGAAQRSIAAQAKQSHTIYAQFHLPAIRCIAGDEPQTRTVNLHSFRDRDWVEDMCANYGAISRQALPTFFPNHP